MRKHKKVFRDEVCDVICDICSRSCLKSEAAMYSAEFAVLNAQWGYWSRKDGQNCTLEICEECFDKIMSFAKTISDGL